MQFKNKSLARHLVSFFCCIALVGVCVCLLKGSGVITSTEGLYSGSVPYRLQTDAFLRGRIGIFDSPEALKTDLVWYNDTAQQVWGLAVPLIRLPFEFLIGDFPDRLVFLMWMSFVAISCFFLFRKISSSLFKTENSFVHTFLSFLICITILFLPAFFSILHSHFNVYEEVVAYSYLASFLFLWPILFPSKSKTSTFLWGLFMGMSALFRPTLAIYGSVAFVLTFVRVDRIKKYVLFISFILGIFIVGGSNQARFGAFYEVGHGLNLAADPLNNYQLKFDYAYKKVPFLDASRELIGALFFTTPHFEAQRRNFRFESGQIKGEADAVRWREMGLYQFSPGYVFVIPLVLFVFVSLCVVLYKKGFSMKFTPKLVTYLSKYLNAVPLLISQGLLLPSFSFAGLFSLYLYSPSIASRYLVDFGSAVVLLLVFLIFGVAHLFKKASLVVILLLLLFISYTVEVWAIIESQQPSPGSATQAGALHNTARFFRERWKGLQSNSYRNSDSLEKLEVNQWQGLPFNGAGWLANGDTQSSILFYVSHAKIIKLTMAGDCNKTASILEAKIGTRYIHPIESVLSSKSMMSVFKVPDSYTTQTWPVFVRMLPVESVKGVLSECKLTKVEWN